MSLKKKLHHWEDANLLSADTVQKILAFEKTRKSNRFSKSLNGLGAFAILIGILAIVASNWQSIPQNTKLILHILMNAGVAFMIYKTARDAKKTKCELWIFGLMGLTLTFIGLCGQVFHLKGDFSDALILWSILCTPFVIVYGKSVLTLLPWIIGLLATFYLSLDKYILNHLGDQYALLTHLGVSFFLPLILITTSSYFKSKERKPLQAILYVFGAIISIVSASIACQLWYKGQVRADIAQFISFDYIILATMVIVALAALKYIKTPTQLIDENESKALRIFLGAGIITASLPFLIPIGGSTTFLSATMFIGYWLVVGYCAQRMYRDALVTLAIVIIAVRIYVIYLELFGSMIMTGFGLIVSGLVLMGMAWATRKIQKRIIAPNNDEQGA